MKNGGRGSFTQGYEFRDIGSKVQFGERRHGIDKFGRQGVGVLVTNLLGGGEVLTGFSRQKLVCMIHKLVCNWNISVRICMYLGYLGIHSPKRGVRQKKRTQCKPKKKSFCVHQPY